MKKNLFWLLLGGIVIIQVILYFLFIAPQGSELGILAEELQNKSRRLEDLAKKEIPTADAIAKHSEHKRLLEEEYKKVVQFYRNKDDMSLEKWFVGSPGSPPPVDWFKAKYADEFNLLRRKCEEAGLRIVMAPADASDEERKIVAEWPKPATSDASETLSKGGGFGFWEAQDITTMNQKTAQKQYWVQKTVAEAFLSAGTKALVGVSFAKLPKPKPAGKVREEKEPQTEFEKLFDVIEVKFLVQVDYKNIGKIMSAVNASDINFLFRSMRVVKPVLREIAIEKKPSVQKLIHQLGSSFKAREIEIEKEPDRQKQKLILVENLCGTFPKVFPWQVDLGSCDAQKLNGLPTQSDLLPEPPALVEFYYWVLDFKGE